MVLNQAYYLISRLRSLNYFVEYGLLRAMGLGFDRITKSPLRKDSKSKESRKAFDKNKLKLLDQQLTALFRADAERIGNGTYPASVLIPEDPRKHLKRIPFLIWDGLRITQRRKKNLTKHFEGKAQDRSRHLPEYYQRNFHFQTDGYLSEQSAELYEHQVELLFAGSADAMRRLIIAPMKAALKTKDGEGLTFLELAAGTGRATRFVRLAFPKAKIIVSDISSPYLKLARKKLEAFDDLGFVEAAAETLPFSNQQFDAVYSVFLFHELPIQIRKDVVGESRRVLKPGGFLGAVDSLQLGDLKDFDEALKDFPKEFHEPFYANYIQNPLETLFDKEAESKAADLNIAPSQRVNVETGFLSKVVWTKNQ